MMAQAGIELETLISEPDTLTTQTPPCAFAMQSGEKTNCFTLYKSAFFLFFSVSNILIQRPTKNTKQCGSATHVQQKPW